MGAGYGRFPDPESQSASASEETDEVPPPPPPPSLGTASHDLGPYCGVGGVGGGGEFSPMFIHVSPINRASSPANDLGYHTLVGRSNPIHQWPMSPELTDLQTDLTHHTDSSSDTFRRVSSKTASSSKKFAHSRTRLITTTHKIGLDSSKSSSAPYNESLSLVEGSTGKELKRHHSERNVQYFESLTDEAVLHIFSFLSSAQLVLCSRVCRRWHVLAWEPQLWSAINLSGENVPADRALKGITRTLGRASPPFCHSVERVILNNCYQLSDRGLQTLSRRCPEIKHVELRGCHLITDAGVLELVTRSVHLKHLDVSGCSQISCIDTQVMRHHQASPSDMRYSSDLRRQSPSSQYFLQLQYLDLTDCVNLGDEGLQRIVQSCHQLSCLFLRRCVQITDTGIKYLASYCTALKELSISDCIQVTDFGMYELARLGSNLRYLSIAKCEQISDAGLKQIGRHCYKLRYLNLRGCEAVSDDALDVLARSCSRLRAIDLGKCDITDRGLLMLAEHCPNLKKLSVKSCELVTDGGIRSIAFYCRGLRQLNIQDCLITIEGYRAVKKYCRKCIIEHTNPGFF